MRVAAVWRTVLRLDADPAPEDDFFALGGDSVDVLDAIARLRERGVAPPAPLAFYRARTVAAVAALCAWARPFAAPADGHRGVGAREGGARETDGSDGGAGSPSAGPPAGAVAAGSPSAGHGLCADRDRGAGPAVPPAGALAAGCPSEGPATQVWPLSPVQRGFWLAEQAGISPAWTARVPLRGPLDPDALATALSTLVERHPLLRVVIVDGAQHVLPTRAVTVLWEDLSGAPDPAPLLDARWEEARRLRWDLARGPLFRLRVLRLGPASHVLLLAAHHIVADAWSAWLLAAELLQLHDAAVAGVEAALPPLRADFSAEVLRALAERPDPWWTHALAGLAQAAAPPNARTAEARVTLDPTAWVRLRRHARRHARTPFVVVLAALAEALQEVAPSPDLLVSIALAGRDDPATAGVVGPFAAGLPVRVGPVATEDRVAAALDTALAHPSVAGVAAAAGGLAPLARYFLTWLDPAMMPAATDRLDWHAGRYRFEAGGTNTEVLAAALVGEGLRIDLLGGPVVDRLAPAFERRLRARCRPDAALIVYLPDEVPPEAAAALAAVSATVGRAVVEGAAAAGGAAVAGAAAVAPAPVHGAPAPLPIETVDATLGSSELVLLPIRASALADVDLPAAVARAAASTEARVVALAGMLPALTGLGLRPLWEGGPTLTTGHAATVVAMLLTLEEALRRAGRAWRTLTVGWLGLGAIGAAVRALAVHVLGPPGGERLSDPRLGHTGDLRDADWILAATSGGATLDVASLRPGTVVIDDSFPRAFDDTAARARMERARDVLLVGGGMLDLGPLDRRSPFPGAEALRARYGGRWLPGCHAEALLVAADPAIGPTVGPVDLARALVVRDAVLRAGLRAAPLHLGGWVVSEEVVAGVRRG